MKPTMISHGALLCVFLASAAFCACMASKATAPTSDSAAPRIPVEGRAAEKHAEIDRLWNEIESWRADGGIAEPMSAGVDAGADSDTQPQPRPMPAPARERCPDEADAAPQACTDVCRLTDSICGNAESICRIAGDLPGDKWAAGKCESAKATCSNATERCCKCRRGGT